MKENIRAFIVSIILLTVTALFAIALAKVQMNIDESKKKSADVIIYLEQG